MQSRRNFLKTTGGAGLAALMANGATGQAQAAKGRPDWSAAEVAHVLPTVSHERLLLKASFKSAQQKAPFLSVGSRRVRGTMTDTAGECWQFDAAGLSPASEYKLKLLAADGAAMTPEWTLRTFPAPGDNPSSLRLLIYTCAGGHDVFGLINGKRIFQPVAIRQRLLRRALQFAPDALIANGDHVYWDLAAPRAAPTLGGSKRAIDYAGKFDSKQPVLGTANERFVKRAGGDQIAPLYGTLCRSVPVFFVQDDHDFYDNDEATDEMVTFPPNHAMVALARATQRLYYPEFLPDSGRPIGLPGSSAPDRAPGVSEWFGTLRYGRLAEVLLYSVRPTMTMAGPTAVFLAPDVEDWLKMRMATKDTAHLVHIPSNPPGWSAGKWGEWYPDLLGADGKLSTARPKPYWQTGWLAQHDRLLEAASAMPDRIPLFISGDLHATAEGRIFKTGKIDLRKNPVHVVLAGTLGTSDLTWPSAFRGVGALPSAHLDMQETIKPVEENGFIIADFTNSEIQLRYFRWNAARDPIEAIDTLEPFHTTKLARG